MHFGCDCNDLARILDLERILGLNFKDLERILDLEMVLVCDFNDLEKDSRFGKDWEGERERERNSDGCKQYGVNKRLGIP